MPIHTRLRPARILLVEDDHSTARLIEIALKRSGFPHLLDIVSDGPQALATLEDTAFDLLLLDLYIPGKNGFEVLEHVKAHHRLRRIPVVVFSTSTQASDVNRAYDLHANAYVVKPLEFSELCRTLDSIVQYWLGTAHPAGV